VRLLLLFSLPRGITRTFRFFILAFVLLLSCGRLCAQAPEDAVRGLARRVAEIREPPEKAPDRTPEKLAVEWVNASSLPEAESVILREAFLKEFSAHRAVVAASPGVAAGVQVSVRETPTEFLVVARVTTPSGEQVRMTGLPRTAFLPVMTRGNGLRLAKQLLWQQAEPIVDAGEFSDFMAGAAAGAANIFLLKPDGVVVYRENDDRLNEIQALPFSASIAGYKYVSRGLRGELHRAKDGAIAVTVPGLNCSVRGPAAAGERWTMSCAAAPTAASSGTSAGGPGPKASGAAPADAEAVTLGSGCDGSAWRLLGEAVDWTQADRLLLVNGQMKKEEAVASLEFAGPVRRLSGAEDGKSAVAVAFDLSSGSYEIFRITLLCGR